jgi:hypothetical protein
MGNTSHDAQPTEATGAVRVIIGTDAESAAQAASRTVVPANPGFTYTLSFSAEGRATVTRALDGNVGDVSLSAGAWTLRVTGQKNGETVAEADSVSVTVSEEGTTVSVLVRPTLDGAAGTFRYAVFADDPALSEVSAVLTPLNVGNAEQSATDLTIGSEVEQSVAAGYYRLTVRAMKGTQPLIRRETVHVYSYTETYKSYTLTAGDFAAVIYLGGVLSGDIDGYTPVAVVAYGDEDADDSAFFDESALSESEDWSLVVEDTFDTIYFKVRLAKDGETYYSRLIMKDIPANGKMDIELPVEGYTITFDANGGAFEDGGDTITMIAPENGTLTLPPVSWDGRNSSGWYSEGKPFTAETRISGDTTVQAKWWLLIRDIVPYLEKAAGGESTANPIPVAVSDELGNGGWADVLAALTIGGKYVSLDVSPCTMDGTEFKPGTDAGANRVVALILPDAAKSIQAGTSYNPTFRAFTVLESLSGTGVNIIGDYAFFYCGSLTSVSLPVATSIGEFAFCECTSLETVSLPAARNIYDFAFWGCTSLESVSLPRLRNIYGTAAFGSCTSLTEVSLPMADTIGYEAFYRCTSLTEVSLPEARTISTSAFSGCTSLTEVSLPKATTIGGSAFSSCTSLETVSLPKATTIGGSAFSSCTSLESVSLPVATTIDGSAFSSCTSLESVSLPASLTTVAGSAFGGCLNLTTITVDPANTAFTARDGMLLNKAETTLIAYPSATGAIALPSIIEVGASAFGSCANLTSVSLPVAQTIGASAFGGCTNLTSVSLPAATTIAGGESYFHGAFHYCTSLTEVNLPTATDIGSYAFFRCTSLETVSLPAAQTIGASAFLLCTSLETVSLPKVETIGGSAFSSCKSLTEVSLPAATTIGYDAFKDCTSLETVNLLAAQTIGGVAFLRCASLTSVSLPAAQTIGEQAFEGCTSLASVSLPAATTIGDYAFESCTSLTEVSLPATPPSINGDYAIFRNTGSDGTIAVRVPAVPTGAVSAYTVAWGVSVSTAVNGNTSVYGYNHKAVFITEEAQ